MKKIKEPRKMIVIQKKQKNKRTKEQKQKNKKTNNFFYSTLSGAFVYQNSESVFSLPPLFSTKTSQKQTKISTKE